MALYITTDTRNGWYESEETYLRNHQSFAATGEEAKRYLAMFMAALMVERVTAKG